ncbi:MAG: hypothetical protein RRA92_01430, partial [Gemmatimonadota bacterium]|nr:hypothetical protein [Gemmatimonadota bacterium]
DLLSLSRFDEDVSLLEADDRQGTEEETTAEPRETAADGDGTGEALPAGRDDAPDEVDFDALVEEVLGDAGGETRGGPGRSESEPVAGEPDEAEGGEGSKDGEPSREDAEPPARKAETEEGKEPPAREPELVADGTPESEEVAAPDALEGDVRSGADAAAVAPATAPTVGRRTLRERRFVWALLGVAGVVLVAFVVLALLRIGDERPTGGEGARAQTELAAPSADRPPERGEAGDEGSSGDGGQGEIPPAGGAAVAEPDSSPMAIESVSPEAAPPDPVPERIDVTTLTQMSERVMGAISSYYGRDVERERGDLGCPELQAAFVEVMDAWIDYSGRGKAMWDRPLPDDLARRDERLYRGVQDVERLFAASGCPRP